MFGSTVSNFPMHQMNVFFQNSEFETLDCYSVNQSYSFQTCAIRENWTTVDQDISNIVLLKLFQKESRSERLKTMILLILILFPFREF